MRKLNFSHPLTCSVQTIQPNKTDQPKNWLFINVKSIHIISASTQAVKCQFPIKSQRRGSVHECSLVSPPVHKYWMNSWRQNGTWRLRRTLFLAESLNSYLKKKGKRISGLNFSFVCDYYYCDGRELVTMDALLLSHVFEKRSRNFWAAFKLLCRVHGNIRRAAGAARAMFSANALENFATYIINWMKC